MLAVRRKELTVTEAATEVRGRMVISSVCIYIYVYTKCMYVSFITVYDSVSFRDNILFMYMFIISVSSDSLYVCCL